MGKERRAERKKQLTAKCIHEIFSWLMGGSGGHKVTLTWREASRSEDLGMEVYLGPGKHLNNDC